VYSFHASANGSSSFTVLASLIWVSISVSVACYMGRRESGFSSLFAKKGFALLDDLPV
jgi:hypothetical protein